MSQKWVIAERLYLFFWMRSTFVNMLIIINSNNNNLSNHFLWSHWSEAQKIFRVEKRLQKETLTDRTGKWRLSSVTMTFLPKISLVFITPSFNRYFWSFRPYLEIWPIFNFKIQCSDFLLVFLSPRFLAYERNRLE